MSFDKRDFYRGVFAGSPAFNGREPRGLGESLAPSYSAMHVAGVTFVGDGWIVSNPYRLGQLQPIENSPFWAYKR